jgi:pimeloyl-ACP methyl ester carboxylesterase
MTTESRGPDGSFTSYAEADVFEVWADIARHYALNPDWTAITGYSMGGIGTFTLAEQFPDLFARAQPTVGESPNGNKVASLRNIPFLMWNVAADELVPPVEYIPTALALDGDGYRYELEVFAPGEHNTLAINDEYAPAAAFLGTATVDRNPADVTYVLDPGSNYPKLGFVGDHAYWLSRLRQRTPASQISLGVQALDTGSPPKIDVRSHGFGVGDPTASSTQLGAGTLVGGTVPVMAYTRTYKAWGPAPSIPREDRLDITATDIAHVTIDVARAHVDCNVALNVTTDGPLQVDLAGCGVSRQFGD